MQQSRIRGYIDGFNLYFGLYKGFGACPAAHKWLNLVELCREICRNIQIQGTVEHVYYCTALTLPSVADPDQAARQQYFLRALGGIPELQIVMGKHIETRKSVMNLDAHDKPVGYPFRASVREEKGSDVNLATFLVRDAALGLFDTALVISNDTDLENAVRVAIQDFGKQVIVVSPHFRQRRVAPTLQAVATRSLRINPSWLSKCLLTDPAIDANGRLVHKPSKWN